MTSETGFLENLEALVNASDPMMAWDVASAYLNSIGIDQVVYAYCDWGKAPADPKRMSFLCSMSPRWIDHYISNAYAEHDAGILVRQRGNYDPLPMGEAMLRCDWLSAETRNVMEENVDAGMQSGTTIVFGSDEQDAGLGVFGITLGSSLKEPEYKKLKAAHQKEILLMAQTLHLKANPYVMAQSRMLAPLTPREKDCLLAVVQGERVDRIAAKLGIAPVTASLHIRNARRKLGARTLPEAIAIAIRLGLIVP